MDFAPRSLWGSVLLFLVLLVSGAAPALAQGRVRFERKAHLEQYEAQSFSEFFDLYDLRPFEQAEGQTIDGERLAELRSAWAAERARVEALLETERADPKRWSLFLLERQLGKHPFFSKIGWTRLDDVEGFVVYVQDPKKYDRDYALRVAREIAGPLALLRRHFHEAYVVPSGLVRKEEFAAEVLFVLSSMADFGSYAELAHARQHYNAVCDYNAKLRLVVLCETPFEARVTRADRRGWAQHAYAHYLLHAHDSTPGSPLHEDWLREGLATYLAWLVDDGRGGLKANEVPTEVLRRLLASTNSPATVLTHLWRIGDLYLIASYQHVASHARVEARRTGRDPEQIDFDGMYHAYWRQMLLLVDYLQRGERLAGFRRLLADELSGQGGVGAFQRAYPQGKLEDFDRTFFEHLFAEHRRRLPNVELAPSGLEALLAWDASRVPLPEPVAASPAALGEGRTGAAPVPPAAAPAPAPRAFEPAELAPRELEPAAQLALCLDLARRGRSADALSRLAQTLEGELEADLRARLERAGAQLGAWNRLRRVWFEGLAASGGSFRLEHGGRTVRAKIARVEEERIQLEPNRAGIEVLELDELDPLELQKQMGKEAETLPDAWARALPPILAGDRRALRLLDRSDGQQAALAEDAAGDLPSLLARGFALGELELLSRTPIPAEPEACEELLARLAALVGEHGSMPEVTGLRPQIRAYARLALRSIFDGEGPGVLLRGTFEKLPGDWMRLSYDFEDPAQLEDFVRDDAFHKQSFARLGDLRGTRSDVAIRAGGLVAHGQVTLRHRLAFRAPMAVRYELSFEHLPEIGESETWHLLVGICADRQGNYAGALNLNDLEAVTGGRPLSAYSPERIPVYMGLAHRMEFAHDGEDRLRLSLGGTLQQELAAPGLGGGDLFLTVRSDYLVRLDRLVIEGLLEPGRLAAVREAWLDERLLERGF